MMKPTLASQNNGGNDYLYSLKEGKTNEYRSGTSKSE